MEKIKDNISEVILQMQKNLKIKQSQLASISNIDLSKETNKYLEEEKLINKITFTKEITIVTAGVDSGFLSKQLNFSNITIVKEAGVVFKYNKGRLTSSKYFPKINNKPTPYLTTTNLELEEVLWTTSILRLSKELEITKKILDETKDLECLFIDGSIIPQYINKPTKECKSREKYNKLIEYFNRVYQTAKTNKTFLIGCVEDSRGARFFTETKESYFKEVDFEFSDTFYVSSILKKHQRTGIVKYSKEPKSHPVLVDFSEEIYDNLYVFYIKMSEEDYPLRIEFIYFKEFGLTLYEYVEKISFIVASLSYHNKSYVYPLPLIEADIRSRLTIKEIEFIINQILEKTKKFGFRLQRRETRFF